MTLYIKYFWTWILEHSSTIGKFALPLLVFGLMIRQLGIDNISSELKNLFNRDSLQRKDLGRSAKQAAWITSAALLAGVLVASITTIFLKYTSYSDRTAIALSMAIVMMAFITIQHLYYFYYDTHVSDVEHPIDSTLRIRAWLKDLGSTMLLIVPIMVIADYSFIR